MSVRVRDASFSLKNAIAANSTKAREAPAAQFAEVRPARALKFDLNGLSVLPLTNKPETSALNLPSALSKFDVSTHSPFKGASHQQQDIIHMSARVEELAAKLRIAQHKASSAEATLHTTQASLIQERQNASTRLKSASEELGKLRAVEAELRSELSKAKSAAKSAPRVPEFNNAVSAAMEADKIRQQSDVKIEELSKQIEHSNAKIDLMTEELIEMHTKNSDANQALRKALAEGKVAEEALTQAKLAEATLQEERSHAVHELSVALENQRRYEEIATQQTVRANDTEERSRQMVDADLHELVKKTEHDAAEARLERQAFDKKLLETQAEVTRLQAELDLATQQSLQAQETLRSELERATTAEADMRALMDAAEQSKSFTIDADKMRNTYDTLRREIVNQSKLSDNPGALSDNAKVQSLVEEARLLKQRYELLFGDATGGAEKAAQPTPGVDAAVRSEALGEPPYERTDDDAASCMYKYSASVPLVAALQMQLAECQSFDVCEHVLPPLADIASVDASEDETEHLHDQQLTGYTSPEQVVKLGLQALIHDMTAYFDSVKLLRIKSEEADKYQHVKVRPPLEKSQHSQE